MSGKYMQINRVKKLHSGSAILFATILLLVFSTFAESTQPALIQPHFLNSQNGELKVDLAL